MRELSTPVVLIIFNRPKTTQLVFEEIARAKPTTLYIVSDGPRANRADEKKLVEQCRQLVSGVDWPCEVFTKYSDENLGCKRSVVEGLDWVFSNEGEAIILEDDCVPTPEFFEFCQEMLRRYKNEPSIGTICGTNLEDLSSLQADLSYWYSRYPAVWGWATWRDVWVKYEGDLSKFSRSTKNRLLVRIVQSPSERRYWKLRFESVASGRVDTWDYQLAFMQISHRLLSVIPSTNLVSNIGFGPDATHTLSPPSRNLHLATGRLRFPITGPSQIQPLAKYDEAVSKNRLSIGILRSALERFYFASPRVVKEVVRHLIRLISLIRLSFIK